MKKITTLNWAFEKSYSPISDYGKACREAKKAEEEDNYSPISDYGKACREAKKAEEEDNRG